MYVVRVVLHVVTSYTRTMHAQTLPEAATHRAATGGAGAPRGADGASVRHAVTAYKGVDLLDESGPALLEHLARAKAHATGSAVRPMPVCESPNCADALELSSRAGRLLGGLVFLGPRRRSSHARRGPVVWQQRFAWYLLALLPRHSPNGRPSTAIHPRRPSSVAAADHTHRPSGHVRSALAAPRSLRVRLPCPCRAGLRRKRT